MSPADPPPGDKARLLDELREQGIQDPRVLDAIAAVPRPEFVPRRLRELAWRNHPLDIGLEQTISQPYIVACMTEAARLGPGASVLEVGTGSGYQAAVLAEVLGLGPGAPPGAPRGRLATIEILPDLAARARAVLERLGYADIVWRVGDGAEGWPERAPFDAILVTAAPAELPEKLAGQLAPEGRLVIPVGDATQELVVVTRRGASFDVQPLLPVRFVPMTGQQQAGNKLV